MVVTLGRQYCLKKNQTTPRPSEHPPVMGEKIVVVQDSSTLHFCPFFLISAFFVRNFQPNL